MAGSITFNNNNNWTPPANMTGNLTVHAWGAGGAGGANNTTGNNGAAGGSGGAHTKNTAVPVVFGITYPLVVGAGGALPANNHGNGGNGGNTNWNNNQVLARGGIGGGNTGVAAVAGNGANSTPAGNNGGNSAAKVATGIGSGGGSSAGNAANGRNAQGQVGGGNGTDSANLPAGAGAGGNGGSAGANGANGVAPGGAGGGTGNGSKNTPTTGAGALGQIILSWSTNDPPVAPTLTSPSNTATGVSTAPTLDFSTTDPDSDLVRYEVQVDTANTFQSGTIIIASANFGSNAGCLYNLTALTSNLNTMAFFTFIKLGATGVDQTIFQNGIDTSFGQGIGFYISGTDGSLNLDISFVANLQAATLKITDTNEHSVGFQADPNGNWAIMLDGTWVSVGNAVPFAINSSAATVVGGFTNGDGTVSNNLNAQLYGTAFYTRNLNGQEWNNLVNKVSPLKLNRANLILYLSYTNTGNFGLNGGSGANLTTNGTIVAGTTGYSHPIIDSFSGIDNGFGDITNSTDTDPYPSGDSMKLVIAEADFPTLSAETETDFASSVTSMPINLPSNIKAGDLLLVFLELRNSSTFTIPTGWIQLGSTEAGGGAVGQLSVFYRIADGTEGATATWTAGTSSTGVAQARKVTVWDGTTPPEIAFTNGDSSAADPTSLSPSWGSNNNLWIAVAGHASVSAAAWSAGPSGYSDFHDSGASSGGSAVSLASAYRTNAASSEDPGAFTVSGSNRFWAAATIAVKPRVAVSALSSSTQYFWRVRATDPQGSGGWSAWSSTFSFTTAGGATTRTKTFTADGIVLVHTTKTFTSDGIVQVQGNLKTFTADGIVQVQKNLKTFTADGIVKATQTKTFTADGVILVQGNTKTFTADGIVKVTTTKTFTSDGIIKVTSTKTFTSDGIVKATQAFTFTSDGIVKATQTKTFTVDGVIEVLNTKTFTVDGIIFATNTKTFTVDGDIKATNTKTFSSDGIIKVTTIKTFSADGIIRVTTIKTFTADAIVLVHNTKTFTADGDIKATSLKTFTADGIIFATNTLTFTVDGFIRTTGTNKTFTVDGIIFATNQKTFTADGVVKVLNNTKTFTSDGIILVHNIKTFTVDAIVKVITLKSYTADGIIKATTLKTFSADGIVLVTSTKTFAVDGIVETFNNKTFTIDGIILVHTTKTFTSDGIIQVRGNTRTFTTDAIVQVRGNLKSFTADGIIKVNNLKTFTSDGVIKVLNNPKTFSIDGIIFATNRINFTIDGIIFGGAFITFTADGIIAARTTIVFTVDGIISPVKFGAPGGRVDEDDWLGHNTHSGGLYTKVGANKPLYDQVSPIHDQDETPRLVNKELDWGDIFEGGSVE